MAERSTPSSSREARGVAPRWLTPWQCLPRAGGGTLPLPLQHLRPQLLRPPRPDPRRPRSPSWPRAARCCRRSPKSPRSPALPMPQPA
eukprot:15467135-Alexandrium_andersonii.AAC.1